MNISIAEANNDNPPIEDEENEESLTDYSLYPKLISIIKPSAFVSFGFVLQNSLGIVSVFSMGHLSTQKLAACALASFWANVSGFSIGIGMASALDTLCSQSFTGSNDKFLMGKHLQRSIIISLIPFMLVSLLWWNTEPLMIILGQDPEISRLAAIYLCWLIPGVYPFFIYESAKRFLQCQGIMNGMIFVFCIASPLNIFLQWLLVFGPFKLDIVGSGIGLMITYCSLPILLWVYTVVFARNSFDYWGGFDLKEMFNFGELWLYLKLGVPGVLHICSEWWAFEIMALASGLLGEKQLAAQSIVATMCGLTYMIPLGISIVATTKIGNAVGSNSPDLARIFVKAVILIGLAIGVFNFTFFFSIRTVWGYLLTQDHEVVLLIATITPAAAFFLISDGFNCVGRGILCAVGHQKVGATLNVAGYYFIGIPLGLYLAFQAKWGLVGLWVGHPLASALVSIGEAIWIYFLDWEYESKIATERMVKSNEEHQRLLDRENVGYDSV